MGVPIFTTFRADLNPQSLATKAMNWKKKFFNRS